MWIHFQNWFQLIVQCASHRDRAGILAVVEVYAHVVLWRFLPFSGPAGWLPKADSYANTMAYSVKNNHEISKYFHFEYKSVLCKSQKLKFDILKLVIPKRFNIFCFNNRWISIKYNEWIGWSYLLFWQAFQHSELLRNFTVICKIWNWEVEKHKINVVLFWSNFEILQECNLKVQ